ncbi:hypothetical protein [Vibrio aquimaris]|uniref:Uncharacterized protein n=1 Tax=Vibrio aquimaris TaxID=2587862 RepID=A0A5P9CKU8_9VIBR|nr:hypothetical protein [Vibrio aquimaris]QFT26583.1 hypothetical protein FIV01_09105 [Vibrio aquimaris]
MRPTELSPHHCTNYQGLSGGALESTTNRLEVTRVSNVEDRWLGFIKNIPLIGDSIIRDELYTRPISNMPKEINEIKSSMIDEKVKEMVDGLQSLRDESGHITLEEERKIKDLAELSVLSILSEGASLQRNHEMNKTRDNISMLSSFISSFMKKDGIKYSHIVEKKSQSIIENYNDNKINEFNDLSIKDKKFVYEEVINSSSKANANLLDKFVKSVCDKLYELI